MFALAAKGLDHTIKVARLLSDKTFKSPYINTNSLEMRAPLSHKKLILVCSLRSVGDIGGKNLLLVGRVVSRAGSLC